MKVFLFFTFLKKCQSEGGPQILASVFLASLLCLAGPKDSYTPTDTHKTESPGQDWK